MPHIGEFQDSSGIPHGSQESLGVEILDFPEIPHPAENGIEQRDHDQTVACTPEGAEQQLFCNIIVIIEKTKNTKETKSRVRKINQITTI